MGGDIDVAGLLDLFLALYFGENLAYERSLPCRNMRPILLWDLKTLPWESNIISIALDFLSLKFYWKSMHCSAELCIRFSRNASFDVPTDLKNLYFTQYSQQFVLEPNLKSTGFLSATSCWVSRFEIICKHLIPRGLNIHTGIKILDFNAAERGSAVTAVSNLYFFEEMHRI